MATEAGPKDVKEPRRQVDKMTPEEQKELAEQLAGPRGRGRQAGAAASQALRKIRKLQQPGQRRAGGVPGEDPLFAGDAAGHDRRVAVGHLLEIIDDREVDVLRQEVLADAFGDVRVDLVLVEDPRLLVLLEHRPVSVDAPYLHRRLLLLEESAHAADGPAGADADHEVIDPAVGLIPDFGAGLLVMGHRVRRVVVLVRLPAVRCLALETGRHRIVRSVDLPGPRRWGRRSRRRRTRGGRPLSPWTACRWW